MGERNKDRGRNGMIQVPGIIPPEYTESEYPVGMAGMVSVSPLRKPRTSPPLSQGGLFGESLVTQVRGMLPRLVLQRKTRKARCRLIATSLNVALGEAEKAYDKAVECIQARLEYEHYVKNQEWYDWIGTPEYEDYVRSYLAEIDRRCKEEDEDFSRRIDDGNEHVISITAVNDEEVLGLLDYPERYISAIQTPISSAIRLTEKDLRILLARGHARVILGDEDTLFTAHKFCEAQEDDEEWKPHVFETPKCAECGAEMDYNQIGLSRKFGVEPVKCQKCLGVPDEYRRNLEWFYKSQGCTMFI